MAKLVFIDATNSLEVNFWSNGGPNLYSFWQYSTSVGTYTILDDNPNPSTPPVDHVDFTPTPEPATLAIWGLGAAGMGIAGVIRRRRSV